MDPLEYVKLEMKKQGKLTLHQPRGVVISMRMSTTASPDFLSFGIYIDDWKRAHVTPIFKSGDRRAICELSSHFYFTSCE